MTTNQEISSEMQQSLGPVLGRIPSGVFILTAGDGQENTTGMLASWVMQASFNPPMVTVAVNQSRYLNQWFKDSSNLVLNLVGENQMNFLKQYGKGFEPDEPAFEGMETKLSESGLPVLTSAIGYMEGSIVNSISAGDHHIYLVEISRGELSTTDETPAPMVHIRKNGFNY